MTQLIQIADDQNTDTGIVRLVAKGETALIPLFTYLISESDGSEFFLQIATANRNLSRFSPSPFDTIALSQMLALMEDNGYAKDAIVANITYYDASVEAILGDDGKPATPFYGLPPAPSTASPPPIRSSATSTCPKSATRAALENSRAAAKPRSG